MHSLFGGVYGVDVVEDDTLAGENFWDVGSCTPFSFYYYPPQFIYFCVNVAGYVSIL